LSATCKSAKQEKITAANTNNNNNNKEVYGCFGQPKFKDIIFNVFGGIS
jgi:hypothetical protein